HLTHLIPISALHSSHSPRSSPFLLIFLMFPPPPRPTLFPYTTLFRSATASASRFASIGRRRRSPRSRSVCPSGPPGSFPAGPLRKFLSWRHSQSLRLREL